MNILGAVLFVWVIITAAIISIGATMVAAALIRKNGLTDINVTNLVMAETCVFAAVLIITLLLLQR